MKQLLIIVLLLSSVTCFAQKKPKGGVNHKDSTTTNIKAVTDTVSPTALPPGTIVYFLSPQQSQVLQYVINESEAPHKMIMDLTGVMQRQQYTIQAPVRDTTSKKPAVDSTAAKHP